MFATSALLIIDLQPIFTNTISDANYSSRVQQTLSFLRTQISPCRIVHIRANYLNSPMRTRSGDLNPMRPVPSESTPIEWAAELTDEYVVIKTTINGFHGTDLEAYLKNQGVDRLYCMGMLTAACVHSTAVGGMNR